MVGRRVIAGTRRTTLLNLKTTTQRLHDDLFHRRVFRARTHMAPHAHDEGACIDARLVTKFSAILLE